MSFFSIVQSVVNSAVGGDYRSIYFEKYPEDKHCCKGCRKTLKRSNSREVTIDHIVPQNAGGTNAITNLQVLCQPCNSKKKAKINTLTLKYSGMALAREVKQQLGY